MNRDSFRPENFLEGPPDRELFRAVVKGANFVTSDMVKVFRLGRYLFAIERGDRFGRTIFGVTVVLGGRHEHYASRGVFYSLADAEEYAAGVALGKSEGDAR